MKKMAVYCNCVVLIVVAVSIFGRVESTNAGSHAPGYGFTVAAGRTIYVADDGPADFSNIQAAINDANNGDTIIVADGTYTGPGNRDINFNGKAITVRSANGPENCIIDCNGTESDRHRGFVFGYGENANSAIIGLTITNGYGPIIWIPPNLYMSYGGAICCINSSPTISNCIISGNVAGADVGEGGGIYNRRGSPTITNCTFSSNRANSDGFGGGMNSMDGSPTLTNCIFIGNSATWHGGGMWNGGNETLNNCILWDNTDIDGKDESAQIYVYGTTPVINYCCIQGLTGALGGIGNIGDEPLFAEPCNGDYHLKSQGGRWTSASSVGPDANDGRWTRDDVTSPCVDAGNLVSPVGLESFPNGGRINMGAYGGTTEASKSYFGQPPCEIIVAGDINGDCIVNFKDFALIAFHWLRDENR